MKIAGISMIRNDADIVEPFVRHTLRLLDHLFVIVHCPQDGTGEILSALHAEGLPMTLVLDDEPAFLQGERLTWLARQAYGVFGADYVFPLDADEFIVPAERSAAEAALRSIPANAVAARIRLRTFVVTSEDPVDEPNPLRRIRFRPEREAKVSKVVLAPSFAGDQTLVIDHGNHGLLRVGTTAAHLQLPSVPQLVLAHYPVRSADQLMNKTIIGYLAHLAAGRPSVEEKRLATHWRRCYEEMILEGATRGMTEQQLLAWFHGRQDTELRSDRLVCDPTPAPDALRYADLVRTGAYATLARFTEALIRSRPGNLGAVRFEHGAETDAAKLEP